MWLFLWIFGVFFYFVGATLAHELAKSCSTPVKTRWNKGLIGCLAALWPFFLALSPLGILWYFGYKTGLFLLNSVKNWLKTAQNGTSGTGPQ